jgi:hypothetical protein
MATDDYAEPKASSIRVLVALREQLAVSRAAGEPCGKCWPATVEAVLAPLGAPARREWRVCLERTRSTWERCYERTPATQAEQALERAHVLLEREPLPDRACVQCDGPLPPGARHVCSKECRQATEVRDRHLGPARDYQHPNVAVEVEEDWSQMELVA